MKLRLGKQNFEGAAPLAAPYFPERGNAMKASNLLGAILITVSMVTLIAIFAGAAYCDFSPSVNLAEAAKETASPCLFSIYRAIF